ncbi:poly-gamma-glutamate hydrolase family protein [Mycobacterium sp. NPDC048908]|uniref:poly-gamma-glutamate hydrolase family protein n=1 Tax=Mycobacterium sp. NPDC048908 TaxID=3364292 RepID=UPI00371C241D
MSAIGIDAGQQVRVVRSDERYALYTVSDVPSDDPNDVVRMGLTGRRRLDTDDEFDAELDSQVVHPTMSDEEAEANGEYVERLSDDGANTALIAIAPHGGDIENHTDDQAQRVASRLARKMAVSVWRCKGYQSRGANRTWHITSTDIDPGSFPLLGSILSRGFTDAVAFHGFDREEILVGGLSSLKADVAAEIEKVLASSNIPVRIASAGDVFGGDDPANIVNRLTAGGTNGVQIEQSLLARTEHWVEIADAVANVYGSRPVRCHRLMARLIAIAAALIRTAVKQLGQYRRR